VCLTRRHTRFLGRSESYIGNGVRPAYSIAMHLSASRIHRGAAFTLWAGMVDGGGVLSALLAVVHACAVVVPVRYRIRAVQTSALHTAFLLKLSHKRRS
jgi:hypothetical protein